MTALRLVSEETFAQRSALGYTLEAMQSAETLERESAERVLASLTEAQVEVMERVAAHLTSKEIARQLNLHPRTVDQRVKAATSKLGATDRGDASRRFIELCFICGRTIYGSPLIDVMQIDSQTAFRELPQEPHFTLEDSSFSFSPTRGSGGSQFLGEFDHRYGRVGRIVLIVAFAIAIALLALTVVSIGSTLNDLV